MADASEYTEKLKVTGSELVDVVKKLVKDGSVRRIVLRDERGRKLASIPVNLGAAVGAVAVIANPVAAVVLAAAGAVGAPLAKITVEIERTDLRPDSAVDATATEVPTTPPAEPQDPANPGSPSN